MKPFEAIGPKLTPDNIGEWVVWASVEAARMRQVHQGRRKPRTDALGRLILRVLEDLRRRGETRPSTSRVWARLRDADPLQEVIQDVGDDHLAWCPHPDSPKLNDLTFAGFKRRLSRLRKKK